MMVKFIGRDYELSILKDYANSQKKASFLVVQGRRRIGKSRLIFEFSKNFDRFLSFSGLAPDPNLTAKHQLQEFFRQLARQLGTPEIQYNDWSDAFWALGQVVQKGNVLVFFDEISWMGYGDPTFLPKIKNLWDLHLKNNSKLVFIVCGSASSWISKNILSSKGFVGRISYTLTLKELPLSDCIKFWPKNVSTYECLKVLSVTGGVPKYLEEINPKLSAEENIKKLCFDPGGLLVNEFDHIFSDLFLRDSPFYRKIVEHLVVGAKDREELAALLGLQPGGRLSEYLDELEQSGFIVSDYTWNIAEGRDSKLRHYRLRDNYLRFYLKYIQKNKTQIDRNNFRFKTVNILDGWDSILGLQFENLVLNSRSDLHKLIGINESEIVCSNPYFQRKTNRHKGCQVDYMIQTKFGGLYVCEIKFSKSEVGLDIIDEVQQKIDALNKPKSFSCRPVLIQVNGVSSRVVEEDYFHSIITFDQFLT